VLQRVSCRIVVLASAIVCLLSIAANAGFVLTLPVHDAVVLRIKLQKIPRVMKKFLLWLALVPFSLLFQTCSHDEAENSAPGNIQFAFQVDGATENGRTAEALVIPPGSNALISIKKHNGQIVYTRKPVEILSFGNGYITAPLALPWGGYYVTEFLIADDENNIIFATPLSGSPLASLIDHPVPFYFAIQADRVTHTGVQTISTDFHMPQAFGYATFDPELISPDLLLTTFVTNYEGGLKAATAHAYVLHGTDTVFDDMLGAKVNTVHFDGVATETYKLIIHRPGFAPYRRTFILEELQDELQGDPLAVVLDPALTMTASTTPGNLGFEFGFATGDILTPKTVRFDWGDGTNDSLVVVYPSDYRIMHTYTTPGEHFVSVTGDTQIITSFGNVYNLSGGNSLNLEHLAELRYLSVNEGPDRVDLSHNKHLESVSVQTTTVRYLDVSDNHALYDLHFYFDNTHFDVASFRKMIADIHSSVDLRGHSPVDVCDLFQGPLRPI
jgi:hypothetical protein